ncbi:MAG: enoyl-CoA hydratase/isomerase family protein [Candidatus Eremiobacteraeota bacterium]|nr:enoyl-CoA hydratase/isomerase family protein [Candidatus Eremiobacteraeota bacterium]
MLESPLNLEALRAAPSRVAFATPSASLVDLGDGVLCLEFHSKGNTLDAGTLETLEAAYEIVPRSFKGLVVGNQGANFSFGANLHWILAMLAEFENDHAAFAASGKRVQRAITGVRAAPFPVVAAPFGLTIGGALELSMYCDAVQAYADLRAGLPEAAIGILPDLGGTSELYARCIDAAGPGNEAAALRQAFETLVFLKRSKHAEDARELRFLRAHDRISKDKSLLLNDAKRRVLELHAGGYAPPPPREAIPVLGEAGFAEIVRNVEKAQSAGMASEHDGTVARAIARVMTGDGGPPRNVAHQELLDLETHYFGTLVWEPKTRARMAHMLETGEPLRN